MTTHEFNFIVEKQLDISKTLLISKGREYAEQEQDRLSAFKKAAALQGENQKAALFGMLAKHLVSLSDMCTSNKHYHLDKWNEKITDAINYLILLKAVVMEEDAPDEKQDFTEPDITLFDWNAFEYQQQGPGK